MSSNCTEFDLRFFTQIDGATIGSLDSGSVTGIFGAIHIDKVIAERCPIRPENYVRFRDDTLHVCEDSNKDQQENIIDWMNDNIYPNKIKFEMKCNKKELIFLDTKVTVGQGKGNNAKNKVYLIPTMYSKKTDIHQYLQPSSCHSPNITKRTMLRTIRFSKTRK